ncbi:MAG: molybdenum cofactor biosynthesis protein C [Bdellovibrionales bacterium RIFOXYD12_FULL_39_22]|nr:MAG: molybdenum cofactor biosynthesis protein C [Bdellovibrionales bacterium RIFOXYB1_FULL_39_21]OFZ42771.1 MAG: molybdenum cofactor biosynthesis protein C [Bdellovibrionales bacterium RIFOXYC12_FULL_39_17]OFZ47330.1 MAG: molybdenum cofactor biosynthesis protein C [Bdellovibrionales bacterium RIFOXYC1_FULL_39_130]OFZ75496.1 MAG: molybdenum cofactor biosynthesis protein C [Bdellovibrionales bacterium RIFOXYD1_FULL_39_84]OFZ93450.1 MAG: molybdenum cofactor biosynthesis protein C [Bdellovibrion
MTHVDGDGKAQMVDVADKKETIREASAYAQVRLSPEAFAAVAENNLKKGDALAVAKLAGIMGAKKTSELIPLCHNIFVSKIDVELSLNGQEKSIEIVSSAKAQGQTGVEMEAMMAVSIAALTIYDMCKAIDKGIEISAVRLLSKRGGKSGEYYYKGKEIAGRGMVVAISVSETVGVQKSNVEAAEFVVDHGIKGDAHAKNWHRQVSFLAQESIDQMIKKGLTHLRPGNFAENITTKNLNLHKLPVGTKVQIGREVTMEITQIGKECHSRCAIYHAAGDCVMPKDGVFAKVLNGGIARVGDEIRIIT